jgi:hypothetical protein
MNAKSKPRVHNAKVSSLLTIIGQIHVFFTRVSEMLSTFPNPKEVETEQ